MKLHLSRFPGRAVAGVLLLLGAAASSAETVSGTLGGALSVDQTGSAGYTIPITVPPGTAGMQPSLSLSYNSNGSNGMLGLGWTLQGLSAISRCPKTKAQDNAHGTVRYDSNDRFCLDGQRLVAVRGTYGRSGTEYRTEIDSFVKVVSRGTAGSGPQYWEVWTKSGQKMEYGRTTTSRVEAVGQASVRQWKLNRVQDTVGNYMTVSYTEDRTDGFAYPSRIDYSGHRQGSAVQAPYASVRFSYGERHDDIVLMQGGYRVEVDKRLTAIRTYVGATLVSNYRLTYSSTGSPYPSRITSIRHCDGVGDCLPGVSLTWNGLGAGSVVSAGAMKNVASSLDSYVLSGDFDGDGRVSFTSTSHPRGYSGYSPLVADYDGDGDSDIGWTLASSRGLYFIRNGVRKIVKTGNFREYAPQTGDFNGDGRADIVWTKAYNGGMRAYVALAGSSGMGTATQTQVRSASSLAQGGASQQSGVRPTQCSYCIPPSPQASADAGDDRRVNENEWMSLPGRGNGNPSWSQVSGPSITMNWPNSASVYFRTPEVTQQTDLVFRLTRTLNGATASDTVTVTVFDTDANPPVNLSPPSSSDYREFEAQVGDFNGDGLADLAWGKAYDGGIRVYVSLGTGTGGFGSAVHTWIKSTGNYTDYKLRVFDLNGDGLSDVVWAKAMNGGLYVFSVLGEGDGTFASAQGSWSYRGGNQNGYEALVGDFNGDGTPDLAWAPKSNTDRNVYISLGDGRGLFRAAQHSDIESLEDEQDGDYSNFSIDHTQSPFAADLNGDGISDIAWRSWVSYRKSGRTTNYWAVHHATGVTPEDYGRISTIASGNGTTFTLGYASLSDPDSGAYTKDSGVLQCSLPCRDIQASQYVVNLIVKDYGSGLTERTSYHYGGAKADLEGRGYKGFRWIRAKDFRTGILTFTRYRQDFPYIGQVERSKRFLLGILINGASGAEGMGGAEGAIGNFISRIARVIQKAKRLADEWNLTSYPFATVLGEEVNTWSQLSLNSSKTKFPYISSSTAKTYELEDGGSNSAVTTVSNASRYDSYGNPTSITVTTTGAGGTFRKVTTNTYANSTSKWHLGRLTCAKVRSEAPGATAATRTSGFAYSSTTGLLVKEVVEPGSGDVSGCVSALPASELEAITLATTYQYDKHGNQRQATTSGDGIASRSSTTVWGERSSCGSVTANGRFPVSVRNALGHAAEHWYSGAFGKVLQSRDANGLESRMEYDGFGRSIRTIHADGRQQVTQYRNCSDRTVSCPSRAVRAILTDRTGAASVIRYLDRRGLVVRTESEGFDGKAIRQDTVYDAAGQAVRKSRPYYAGETVQWSQYTYDKLGRVKSETLPNGSLTQTSYDGIEGGRIRERVYVRAPRTATARTTVREHDALGRVLRTTDPSGNRTSFEYTESGKRKKVTAANGSVTTRTFDLRGRMLSQTDPDRGTQRYAYNALGELVSQTNARGQTMTFRYDLLGRLVHRAEPEGTTVWVYDATATGKGRLAQVSGPHGYLRTHAYDAYGRPTSETVTIGGERFTGSRTYDAAGRVSTLTYPTSGLVVRHEYTATGYLAKVRKNASCGTVYWTAQAVNAEGQVEESLLGNGVGTTRVFDPKTGLVRSIQSGLGETSAVQDLGYVFDAYGNLTTREDFAQEVRESFTYDRLNRLGGSTLRNARTNAVLSSKSYRYDAVGNITNKSDVGAADYVYGAGSAGPHAVTSAGGHTYAYDASGNMVSGAGRTLTWTSFQKPRTIAKGATASTFEYGPERKRIRQVKVKGSVTETVTYVGGLYEQVSRTGAATEHVHYIFAGGVRIAVETASEAANSSAKLRYLHQDHLGSVDVVTNESGAVVERLSFGAFGERRVAQGATTWRDSALALGSSETRRGFTDHEQLDDFALVHMNGRVYDPQLGRFLNADPFVQFALSSQGYNRYTYANNNPLSFTDPSGYFISNIVDWVGSAWKRAKKIFKSKVVRIAASVAFAIYGGPAGANLLGFATDGIAASAIGGFGAGLIASGGDIRSAFIGGATGGAFGFVGGSEVFGTVGDLTASRVVAHGVVGGVSSELSGSKFGAGFFSAGFSKLATPYVNDISTVQERVVTSAVIGGTASEIAGGKFANGAMTAAFGRLYNEEISRSRNRRAWEDFEKALGKWNLAVIGNTGLDALRGRGGRIDWGSWLDAKNREPLHQDVFYVQDGNLFAAGYYDEVGVQIYNFEAIVNDFSFEDYSFWTGGPAKSNLDFNNVARLLGNTIYKPEDYDLLTHNCQCFAEDLFNRITR